jgi:hypothetical protein
MMDEYLDVLYSKYDFLIEVKVKLEKLNYKQKDLVYIDSQLHLIDEIMDGILFKSLQGMLRQHSNYRIKKVLTGIKKANQVLFCPEDYVIIEINGYNDSWFAKDAIVFTTIDRKICALRHIKYCKDGLKYIGNKWQKY